MRSGPLRHRITIEKFIPENRDEDGNFLPSAWVEHKKLWAKITWLSVKDVLVAQASSSETIARCQLRKRDDIETTMRVIYDGQTYAIDGPPLPDAENGKTYMTLMVSSGIEVQK